MNSSERNFYHLGFCDFQIWFDHTGWLICAAFRDEKSNYVMIIDPSNWNIVKKQSNKVSFLLSQGIYYNLVKDIRITKAGWFAWSNADFVTLNGLWSGKTDKGFAEFLTTILPINYGITS